jgi:hypothetical protein
MKRILILTGLLLLISQSSVQANIWYVDGNIISSGSGTEWGQAFKTIQEAVNATTAVDEIWVKKGNYSLSSKIGIIGKDVFLYGGFDGTEISRDQRDWIQNATIVDGQNSVQCFSIEYFGFLTIDGFIITRGKGKLGIIGGMMYPVSGGISNSSHYEGDGAEITNCIFIGNAAPFGGAILNFRGHFTLNNCIFSGNGASAGGALDTNLGETTVNNCIFSGNSADSGGGALDSQGATTIINCTFSENSSDYGASIEIYTPMYGTSSTTIVNSILWGNTGYRGEIYNPDTNSLFLNYCDIDQDGYAGSNGNINAAPMFVGEGDYHLRPGSPCIDNGTSSGAPSTDIEDTSRPQGLGYDMGAYEYVSTTLITLSFFTATPFYDKVIIKWSTESEIDNAGFNLYRSEIENGEYVKINPSLILAKGFPTQGAAYEFVDKDVKNRKIYYYKLEDIDLNGQSTIHGPINATPRWVYRIWK